MCSTESEYIGLSILDTHNLQTTLSFFRHVAKRRSDSLEKLILTGHMGGIKSKGRVPVRWTEAVGKATGKKIQANIHLAKNHVAWRAVAARPTRHDHAMKT